MTNWLEVKGRPRTHVGCAFTKLMHGRDPKLASAITGLWTCSLGIARVSELSAVGEWDEYCCRVTPWNFHEAMSGSS